MKSEARTQSDIEHPDHIPAFLANRMPRTTFSPGGLRSVIAAGITFVLFGIGLTLAEAPISFVAFASLASAFSCGYILFVPSGNSAHRTPNEAARDALILFGIAITIWLIPVGVFLVYLRYFA